MSKSMLLALKVLFAAISLSMLVLTIKTSLQQSLFDVLPAMLRDPWTEATFVDFYFNLTIVSTWMFYKQRSWLSRILWLAAFIGLGSIATAFYVVLQLWPLKPGDPLRRALLRQEEA